MKAKNLKGQTKIEATFKARGLLEELADLTGQKKDKLLEQLLQHEIKRVKESPQMKVHRRVTRNAVKRNRAYTGPEITEILKLYPTTDTNEICRRFNRSYDAIRTLASDHGVQKQKQNLKAA